MFTGCQLEADDSVDVYLDWLEQFGRRIGLTSGDLAFRVKFYDGLPTSVYEWAASQENAYTADFEAVLARVRDQPVTNTSQHSPKVSCVRTFLRHSPLIHGGREPLIELDPESQVPKSQPDPPTEPFQPVQIHVH